MSNPAHISILETAGFADYTLLDCDAVSNLERLGSLIVDCLDSRRDIGRA